MLLQPELLEAVEPDVHLVANLMALSSVMPDLMAAAISRQDLGQWAAAHEIVTARSEKA